MSLAVSFVIFAACVIFTLYKNLPMSLAMSAGFVLFMLVGIRRGHSLKSLLKMSLTGAKGSLIVVRVLLTIGILTGLWRSAGTFAILTAWGLRVITPSMFILVAFILSCVLSYALGTSFGTAGTLGVALMTLARSGGVNPVITAGAIMSGIHFGDRGSPASSCAHLIASLTHTNIYDNVRAMMTSAKIPLIISIIFYFVLSLKNPLINFDASTLNELSFAFNMNPLAISPAVLMLILPFLRVNIFIAFLVSITAAFFCTIFLQGNNFFEAINFALFGLHADEGIKILFNGGGLFSMVQMCLVLIITGTYSGIFGGTGMLNNIQEKISHLIKKFGSYPVILFFGTLMDAIFCNQTVGILMTAQIITRPYKDNNKTMSALAIDLSNATAITAPLVPWCIACSVPLSMLGETVKALPYACYLYAIPLYCLLWKR